MKKNVLKKIIACTMALAMLSGTGMSVSAVETELGALTANASDDSELGGLSDGGTVDYQTRLKMFQDWLKYYTDKPIELLENDEYYYTVKDDGTVTLLFYKGDETDVIVPNEIDGKTVTETDWYLFSNYNELKSVVLPDTLETLKDSFTGCKNLKELNIPANVSFTEVSSYNRYNYLINVSPENKYYSSQDGVLFNKDKTQLLIFPTSKTGKYVIPDTVTEIRESAFSSCTGLTEIIIPDTVKYIEKFTFSGCTGLKEIIIPDSVTKIGADAFSGCTGLTEMIIPDSVTTIEEDLFMNCKNLKSVVFSKNIKELKGRIFYWCDSLENVVIPEGVTTVQLAMFSHCPSMKSLYLPKSVKSVITDVGMIIFAICDGMENITVDQDNPYYTSKDGVLFTKDMKTLVKYPPAKSDDYNVPDSVEKIEEYAFNQTKEIKKITLPDSVSTIGRCAFANNDSLENINIPNGVTSIGHFAFGGCNSLKEIKLPDSLTSLGSSAFSSCTSLTNVTIPGNVRYIGNYTFEHCENLESVVLEEGIKTIYNYAFSKCTSLKEVFIPESVTKIESKNAFYNSENVTIYGYKDSYAQKFAKENNIPFSSAWIDASVSANKIILGQTVTVNVRRYDHDKNYTYAVLYKKKSDTQWTVKQNYSTNNVVTIKPAKATDYDICVKSKNGDGIVEKTFFELTVEPWKNTSSISSGNTIELGQTIAVYTDNNSTSDGFTYSVLYKNSNDTEWTVAQDYSENQAITIKPELAGDYNIRVEAKDSRGLTLSKTFNVSVRKPQNTSKISSSNIVIGQDITVYAGTDSKSQKFTYAVSYKKSTDTEWTVAQNYSENSKTVIRPEQPAVYNILVEAKNSDGMVIPKTFYHVYVNDWQNTSQVANIAIVKGKSVIVNASTDSKEDGFTYAVLYKKDSDTKWTVAQNYSDNQKVIIKPAKVSDYQICVKAKDSNGKIVKKFFALSVLPKISNTSAISSDTIKKGDTVQINASATGGIGSYGGIGYEYAVLYKKKSETKWTVRQGYTSNNQIIVRPYTNTDYDICVKVKDTDGTVSKKYFSVKVE